MTQSPSVSFVPSIFPTSCLAQLSRKTLYLLIKLRRLFPGRSSSKCSTNRGLDTYLLSIAAGLEDAIEAKADSPGSWIEGLLDCLRWKSWCECCDNVDGGLEISWPSVGSFGRSSKNGSRFSKDGVREKGGSCGLSSGDGE